eukprot:TRINITY_DN1493_c2_g1_i1.p1 TRINITY_DN1493_c2_g1~~TRINITY_DN1493_c2_g1_i1.p1  ORF type:complete len:342 (+),score=57.47 TRINITY_DN1493_c2_g1_i1:109-1134(+)
MLSRFCFKLGRKCQTRAFSGLNKDIWSPERDEYFKKINDLVEKFPATSLARAVMDREHALQSAAKALNDNNDKELKQILKPFLPFSVEDDVKQKVHERELQLKPAILSEMSKIMSRIPRSYRHEVRKRAAVFMPLAVVDGVPSIILTKRSNTISRHRGQICFPGGMLDTADTSIIATACREMEEEIGIVPRQIMGILRCDWTEIESLVGVGVTPVVGTIGDLNRCDVRLNPHEVERIFTIPLADVNNEALWLHREYAPPVFQGPDCVIWGLTAYVLDKFREMVLAKVPGQWNTIPTSSIHHDKCGCDTCVPPSECSESEDIQDNQIVEEPNKFEKVTSSKN